MNFGAILYVRRTNWPVIVKEIPTTGILFCKYYTDKLQTSKVNCLVSKFTLVYFTPGFDSCYLIFFRVLSVIREFKKYEETYCTQTLFIL
jgi:hypothetical protein